MGTSTGQAAEAVCMGHDGHGLSGCFDWKSSRLESVIEAGCQGNLSAPRGDLPAQLRERKHIFDMEA